MDYVAGVLSLLREHPVATGAGLLLCSIAARIIGRVALLAFVLAVLIASGGFLSSDFMNWLR